MSVCNDSKIINLNISLDAAELFYFMRKIQIYEPALFEDIKKRVGIPYMKKGDLFRFSDVGSLNKYLVVNVCKVTEFNRLRMEIKKKENKCVKNTYQYGYCMKNYHGFQTLNWIYDSFIESGYIKIFDSNNQAQEEHLEDENSGEGCDEKDSYWERYIKEKTHSISLT